MKSKQFLSGLLIGSILATSVSVFGTGALVSVVKKDNIKIFVDGNQLQAKDADDVLNYNGYNYTSARRVAESLGATVEHQRLADGSERIDITPKPDPEPIIKEVIVEVEKVDKEEEEKEKETTSSSKIDYYEPPLKANALGVSMLVTHVENIGDFTYIRFDLDNKNDSDIAMFDYQNFQLTTESKKLLVPMFANYGTNINDTGNYNNIFLNSLNNNTKYDEVELVFNKLEVGTKFTLNLPITRRNATLIGDTEKETITFNLIVEDFNVDEN